MNTDTSQHTSKDSEMSPEELVEYKQYIASLVNRITSEGCIEPDINTIDEKLEIKIKFKQPEWYKTLDKDIQYHVFTNARFHVIEMLKGLKMLDNTRMDTELHSNVSEYEEVPVSMEELD